MFGPSEFCSEWLVASVCVLGHLQAQANAEIHPWMRRLSHPVWNMGCKHTNTHIHTGTSSFARNTEYKADKQRQKQVNLKLSSQMRCRLLHPAGLCTRRNTKQSVTAIFERRFFSATNQPPNTFKMWCILILKMIFMLTKDVRCAMVLFACAREKVKHTLQIYFGGTRCKIRVWDRGRVSQVLSRSPVTSIFSNSDVTPRKAGLPVARPPCASHHSELAFSEIGTKLLKIIVFYKSRSDVQ